jgi:membrane-associated protease RseP (regulator of RpoE activity)
MEPTHTAYDVRWTMFGIPVRVHPMFWLIALFMGSDLMKAGVQYLLIWVGCLFVSILVHELGHVWMGQAFGSYGHIVLYGFGGLAIGSNQLLSRWQRIAVSFAGPLAGFVFLGVVLLGLWAWDPDGFPSILLMIKDELGLPIRDDDFQPGMRLQSNLMLLFTIQNLIFINLFWGLVNLLPVWPLDGGQISREVCEEVSPEGGVAQSLGISLVCAVFLSLHCLLRRFGYQLLPLRIGSVFAAILFAILAWQSYQLLQQTRSPGRQEDYWED